MRSLVRFQYIPPKASLFTLEKGYYVYVLYSSGFNKIYLIEEHDTKRAEYLFGKYAALLKNTVLNSEKMFVSLREELDFITSYLDLEMFRQANRFTYVIHIPADINANMKIPKMMLHIFVENAVKHGVMHLETKGLIKIEAERKKDRTHIYITDNGIGRKKAAEFATFSTGKGLNIVDQILELHYSLYRIHIRYEIEDMMDGDMAKGTKVNIIIPQ